MPVAFPKPKEMPRTVVHVRVHDDGREVCNRQSAAGRETYRSRTLAMLARQGGRCCLEFYAPMCPGKLAPSEATFEHENGRGLNGGKRDDRIELPDGTWINGAAHEQCNLWKGSRRVRYNR